MVIRLRGAMATRSRSYLHPWSALEREKLIAEIALEREKFQAELALKQVELQQRQAFEEKKALEAESKKEEKAKKKVTIQHDPMTKTSVGLIEEVGSPED